MLPLLAGGLIGLGAGGLKYLFSDLPREHRERALAAATARYSPWTGLKPEAPKEADLMGNAIQFGSTGAAMGQNYESFENAQKESKLRQDWLSGHASPGARNPYAGGSPWAGVKSDGPVGSYGAVPATGAPMFQQPYVYDPMTGQYVPSNQGAASSFGGY
jgi:hypothetical protein